MARVGNFGALGRARRDGLPRRAAPARPRRRARGAGLRPAGPGPGRPAAGRRRRPPRRSSRPCRAARCATSAGSGCATRRYEPLVVDWRAPAAAPFYRATPTDRMGVVRRRTIRSSGEKVIGVEDDLLDPEAAPAGDGGHRRRRAAGRADPGHRARHARHRRDDPARAGRRDPLPRVRRDHRARRAGHRQDRGGPAPRGVPALRRPQPVRVAAACWWSGRRRCSSGTWPGCCPRSARTP